MILEGHPRSRRARHIAIVSGALLVALMACGGHVDVPGGGSSSAAAPAQPPAAAIDGGEISHAAADAASADSALQADASVFDAAPKDDPCPSKLDVNCSTSCGGPTECSQAACSLPPTAGYAVPADDFPFVVRMPSSPGALTPGALPPKCADNCGGAVFYGLHFRVVTTTQPNVRVRVEPPWFVSRAIATADNAACVRVSCMSLMVNSSSPIVPLVVATTDPNAPARNVVIEATSDPCTN